MTSPHSVVCGLGAWVPPRLVTNEELSARLDTSDEWIRTRTGVGQRYVVTPGMATSHLAVEAGARALKSAGLSDVGAVIVATSTPDRPCPATAPVVADRLGLGGVPAFDVAAVCSGFLYALAVATGLISAGTVETVLVIGADTFSTIVDPGDRTTTAVFGDGAGAVVVRAGAASEPGVLGRFEMGSDGSMADLITVRAGGSEQRSTHADPPLADTYFTMQGRQVFAAAVDKMADVTRRAVSAAGWRLSDVDRFVGHQANVRILRATAEQLDIAPDRVVIHLDQVANTAAASIPLALEHAHTSGLLKPGDRVALAAFGGGATWAASTLVWPAISR